MLKKHILTGALVLLFSVTALAQTNATVGGTVGDATGAVIPSSDSRVRENHSLKRENHSPKRESR